MAGYAPKPACIGSCASRRSIPATAATPRSHRCSYRPEIDEEIEIEINPADVRIDTYRASGAGGQHVNKTDSAIRMTHLPTNTVVQCQSERSQHQNRDKAWKQLRAKLYELEMLKRSAAQQTVEDNKADIGWGSQIRSYVLDQSRIKDLRTGIERTRSERGARRRSGRIHRSEFEGRTVMTEENDIIRHRREKLARAARSRSSRSRTIFVARAYAADLQARYGDVDERRTGIAKPSKYRSRVA